MPGTTNYPNLLTSGGIPVFGVGPFLPSNNVFFVHSGSGVNGSGYGKRPSRPYASVHYASAQAEANAGDLIICLPGHVETISVAAGCVLGKAGVTVLGLGNGNGRPVFNFTTAVTADLDIDAANVTIINCRFTGGFDNITAMIDVNASDFALVNCSYRDVTGQVATFLLGDANANRMKILGLDYIGDSAAGTVRAIGLNGAVDVYIGGNFHIDGNFSQAAIECITAAVSYLVVEDGYIRTRNAADLCILDTITGSTGYMTRLNLSLADNAANITTSITGATFRVFDPVYVVNANNEKGMLINWTASTHA